MNNMIYAMPHLCSNAETKRIPLAPYFIKVTGTVHGTNRNVIMDNWATSISLVEEFLKSPVNLTIIGTVHRNKKEIPPKLL